MNEEGEREEGEGMRMGGTGTTAYPHRCRPIHHGLPTRTTTGTCGSGGIRVLHTTDDANRGWCGFMAAGNTKNVWNLDVDKAGAVMLMLVITRSSSLKESNVQDTRK
jgi:hypothetical protein